MRAIPAYLSVDILTVRHQHRASTTIDILSVDGASTLLPIGADVSRGRHLGVVIRSTRVIRLARAMNCQRI